SWCYGASVARGLPILPRHGYDRLELLAPERRVDAGQVPRGPGIEVARDVRQLARERFGAVGLVLGRPTITEEAVAVQRRQILPQPLLARNHAALFGGDDLLPERVDRGGRGVEPARQRVGRRQLRGPVVQSLTRRVHALDRKRHVRERSR